MASRSAILKAVRDVMKTAAAPGATNECIVGYLSPHKAETAWKGYCFAKSDLAEYDDARALCQLVVVTAIVFKTDASNTERQFIQASDAYDAINSKLEAAADTPSGTPLSGLIIDMQHEEPGIVCDGFDDADSAVRIGETWRITYRRARGAAT